VGLQEEEGLRFKKKGIKEKFDEYGGEKIAITLKGQGVTCGEDQQMDGKVQQLGKLKWSRRRETDAVARLTLEHEGKKKHE